MTNLKHSNITEIDNFILNHFNSKIVETKLFALLSLVDKKGSTVNAPDNEYLNGVKVLEYKKGFYIGFKKKVYINGSMQLKTITLKS
jgi:hypothetical protein